MMEKHGVEARNGGEGTADSGWILLDFGSVIVNVMTPVARKYYALEKLWKKVRACMPSLPPSLPSHALSQLFLKKLTYSLLLPSLPPSLPPPLTGRRGGPLTYPQA
jgi:hypothetical protein